LLTLYGKGNDQSKQPEAEEEKMKKLMTVLLTTLLLGLFLAVSGPATTGMTGGTDNSMDGATTEMKSPDPDGAIKTMPAPAEEMMEEPRMESPVMEKDPAQVLDEGDKTMMK
jgi:hypothetical protein